MLRFTGAKKIIGLHGGAYGNVGRNYNNDANAGLFNCNVNNSSSNSNANIGARQKGKRKISIMQSLPLGRNPNTKPLADIIQPTPNLSET